MRRRRYGNEFEVMPCGVCFTRLPTGEMHYQFLNDAGHWWCCEDCLTLAPWKREKRAHPDVQFEAARGEVPASHEKSLFDDLEEELNRE